MAETRVRRALRWRESLFGVRQLVAAFEKAQTSFRKSADKSAHSKEVMELKMLLVKIGEQK